MSILVAVTLLLTLIALAAVGLQLVRALRGDGYGHRPGPRSLADETEPRTRTLARLAR